MTYLPEHFAQIDRVTILKLLSRPPLATVVTIVDEELIPTPVPLIHVPGDDGWGSLIGHAAMANPMWHHDQPRDALVTFNAADTYVTPNWYPTKAETHRVVPTWNYIAIHAWGPITFHHDEKWKRKAVGKLTQLHERDSAVPWKMGDAPQAFLDDQLEHIVGFELQIDRLVSKWKLSQNRSPEDRQGVIDGLKARDCGHDAAIVTAMLENEPDD